MAEAKQPSINVLSGPLAGKKLVIEDAVDNILIGSDASCRFCLDLPGISPIHARLWVDLNGATVYDTNSPRGVYVNDDRVVREAPVRNGDILWLGPPGDDQSVLIQDSGPPGPSKKSAPGRSADDGTSTMAFHASEFASALSNEAQVLEVVDEGLAASLGGEPEPLAAVSPEIVETVEASPFDPVSGTVEPMLDEA